MHYHQRMIYKRLQKLGTIIKMVLVFCWTMQVRMSRPRLYAFTAKFHAETRRLGSDEILELYGYQYRSKFT